ncbi:hypothetical protein BV20DRAFT_1051551 [Pilatotrama ljubarskyi]|nr:hypothetical protein BV20DRAFT_1051551 [Pilatotrama ljubarskyi]
MFDQGLVHRFHPRQTSGERGPDGCLLCPDTAPSCNCGFGQICVLINRDCNTCPAAKCIDADDSSGSTASKGGVSKGAVAAAVVVTILVLAAAVAAFFWYRRRQRLQRNTASAQESKPDVPARAEDVLNRPDPNEKPGSPPPQLSSIRIYSGTSHGTINLDPAASDAGYSQPSYRESVQSNPFGDNHSIQTTSTGAQSNVIPIALVPPGSVGHSSGASAMSHSHDNHNAAHAGALSRADVNLDHVNVSNDSLTVRGASNAASARSGVNENNTGNNRASYMTTGSFASDFLETSVIVTPMRGTVKQVVGVAKAEVLRTPPSDSLSRSSTTSRQARSPLAASSFGPADVMREAEEEQEVTVPANPFSDSNSPYARSSPAPSATTFGTPEPSASSFSHHESRSDSNWLQEDPGHLYGHSASDSRPASVYTQASAIVADISSAKRVHLGFDQLQGMPTTPLSAALSTPRSPYRMTNAKLVSPVVHHSAAIETGGSGNAGALEQQQARALQELAESGKSRRMSMSSVLTTSTRADSILESFPFVPPSPISNRPIRTPPRSPLAQQTFAGAHAQDEHHMSAQETVNRARASASSSSMLSTLAPPNRKMLGMSVASQSSTVSNGLGSFPFQIDTGAATDSSTTSAPPSAYSGSDGSSMRKRASLDTLALTSDLSSYPLGFDKANAPPMPQVPRR